MNVVIVTDIFGCCQFVDNLVIWLEKYQTEVTVIDPYEKERHQFQNEAEAYEIFIEQCGHDSYLNVTKKIISTVRPTLLIGFSAGANVLWRLSEWVGLGDARLLCFYPSQIRYHLDIKSSVSTHVIFPYQEGTFDIAIVSDEIQHNPHVKTTITPFEHGFMNKCSDGYSQEGNRWGREKITKALIALT